METTSGNVSLYGRVSRINAEPIQARGGDYRYTGLEIKSDLSDGRIFIIFPEYSGSDFFEFPKLCWPEARISTHDLTINNYLDDGSLIYCVNPDSELLLEPYRPVSVIEAVESFRCIRSIDLRYRYRNEEPFWLAKGKAIHSLFDQLVCNPGHYSDLLFDKSFSSVIGEFVEVLPGSSTNVTYADFKNELRRHYKNLASWMFKNFGKDYEADTEIDKISIRYGLKGRADAVFYSSTSSTVLEIKSGKFPSEDHLLQLYAYNMLLQEDDEDRKIDSYVVYSSSGLSKRLDDMSLKKKRSILQGRNRSIALRRYYAFKDNLCDPNVFFDCEIRSRCHSKPNCEAFYSSPLMLDAVLSQRQVDYYETWFSLISIDEWLQEAEFADVLDRSTLSLRLADGITIPLQSVVVDPTPSVNDEPPKYGLKTHFHRSNTAGGLENDFFSCGPTLIRVESANGLGDLTMGDEVMIHHGDACSRETIRARVAEISENKVSMYTKIDTSRLNSRIVDQNPSNKAWYIDKIPFLRAREVSRKALLNFLIHADTKVVGAVVNDFCNHANQKRRDSDSEFGNHDVNILGNITETGLLDSPGSDLATEPQRNDGLSFDRLNESQNRAVVKSLSAPIYHLIHGPPGTGKTQVLSRLVLEMTRRNQRVLLACPTNVALDRVLIALMKLRFYEFFRVGNIHGCSHDFLKMSESVGGISVRFDQVAHKTTDFNKFKSMVTNTKLIAATAYQCASNPIFLKQRFDVVVIDEAGQLDEPATLAPLSLGKRFVLCGDHLQLPPVVKSRGVESEDVSKGLGVSLFERLFLTCRKENISSLNVQYRMNAEVQSIPSNLFYGGKLLAAPEVACRRLKVDDSIVTLSHIHEIIDPETPVLFVDVQGGVDTGQSRSEEAEVAFEITSALVEAGVYPSEIGIITPYRAQQSLIRQKLGRVPGSAEISVDTVDRFQGGEREVIIMSLARSDAVTSFLADPKRLNVSLSRARSKLILLGRASVLEEHPLFQATFCGLKKVVINK